MKRVMLCAVVAILAGCAIPQQQTYEPLPFNAAEYEALPKTGTGVVRGQVFLKTRGGDVKKGAGSRVILAPATSQTEQMYAEGYRAGKVASGVARGDTSKYWKHAVADAEGRFEFREVPPGKYFAISEVFWEAPTQFGLARQGGALMVPINCEDGKVVDAILTR